MTGILIRERQTQGQWFLEEGRDGSQVVTNQVQQRPPESGGDKIEDYGAWEVVLSAFWLWNFSIS